MRVHRLRAVALPLAATLLLGVATPAGAATADDGNDAPEVLVVGTVADGSTVHTVGRVRGAASTTYTLGVAGVDATGCDEGDPGGARYGTVEVTTDDDGVGAFGSSFSDQPKVWPHLRVVTATVLDGGQDAQGWSVAEGWGGSRCSWAGAGNDTWSRARPLTSGDTATDIVDLVGSVRWFRVPVEPGARLTVRLSDMPVDYDLAVFADIVAEYEQLVAVDAETDLNVLGAEYAPTAQAPFAFSPFAFSPATQAPFAFSPFAFSPFAFSPSVLSDAESSPFAFSPFAFSPFAFSPFAFSPFAFSPFAFSPFAFSDAASSPFAFSDAAGSPFAFSDAAGAPFAFSDAADAPFAFSKQAFSAAQGRSLLAVSASGGTADETVELNTWDADGDVYIRVSGGNGAFHTTVPFQLDVQLDGADCTGVRRLPGGRQDVAALGVETVVLWDSQHIAGSAAEVTQLAARLEDLAQATDGRVVDLAWDTHVLALRRQAQQHPGCVFATNLLAEGIKQVVDAHREANELAYVVLVGADDAVPFFRYPDEGQLGPESSFSPPMRDASASQSALRSNYVLGQDEYGADTVLALGATRQPVPDLAVGRLVETAVEVTHMLDVHLDGGPLTPRSTLVTGYDFLADAADAVDAELRLGTDDARATATNDRLVTAGDVAPDDPRSWSATELRDAFLDPAVPHDVVYLAGHFSASSALAADYRTSISTADLDASGVDLEGSLVFSGGCHSGYSIVDEDAVPGLTVPLDWAQAMAQQGATLVAGTGYQYGDTDLVEFSERLYAGFARELRRGTGVQTIGEALVRAKLEYLQRTPDPRGLHRKSLLIATVFGLPMAGVEMPGQRLPVTSTSSAVRPRAVSDGDPGVTSAGEQHDLASATLTVDAPLREEQVALTLPPAVAGGEPRPGPVASYLVGSDGTASEPNAPILPLVSTDVTAPGRTLMGVGLRAGTFRDERVVPLSAAATTELRGVHVPLGSTTFVPQQLANVNRYGALGADGRTRLLVTPAQHRVSAVGDLVATRRVFSELELELFYLPDDAGTPDSTAERRVVPARSDPPSIVDVVSRPVPGTRDALVEVRVAGDPAVGVERVWMTRTVVGDDAWSSVELEPSVDDSTRWSVVLPGAAARTAPLQDFIVQAVSGVGLVAVDDAGGALHRLCARILAVDSSVPAAATSLELAPLAPRVAVGGTVAVEAVLRQEGEPLAGQPVVLAVGDSRRSVISDADGVVRAQLPVTGRPGPVAVTARYVGEAGRSAAGASAETTVVRASSVLRMTPDGHGGLVVDLRDATGSPLGEQTVRLTGADGQRLAVITSPSGVITAPVTAFTAPGGSVRGVYPATATHTAAIAVETRDPAPTEISLRAPASKVFGSPAVITVRLNTAVGRVVGVPIEITVDGVARTVRTNRGGVATVIASGLRPRDGGVPVTATFAGDDNHQPADARSAIQVVAAPTRLTLDAPSSLAAGSPAPVTARLTADGEPVAGARLRVGAGRRVVFATTDADGTVRVPVVPARRGELEVRVGFAGTPAHAAVDATLVLDVARTSTRVTLDEVARSSEATASGVEPRVLARLLDVQGRPLPGRAVSLRLTQVGQDPVVLERVTAADGSVRPGPVLLPAGRWTLEVLYDGVDGVHAPSQASLTTVVDGRAVLLSVRARLEAALPTIDDAADGGDLRAAIHQVSNAATPARWRDGRPLEGSVFTAVAKAVLALDAVDDPALAELTAQSTDLLVRTSRFLAVEATATGAVADASDDEVARAGGQLVAADGLAAAVDRVAPDAAATAAVIAGYGDAFDTVVDDAGDRRRRLTGEG